VGDGLNDHQNQTTNHNGKANAWQALHSDTLPYSSTS
jgi:hypothetical protein